MSKKLILRAEEENEGQYNLALESDTMTNIEIIGVLEYAKMQVFKRESENAVDNDDKYPAVKGFMTKENNLFTLLDLINNGWKTRDWLNSNCYVDPHECCMITFDERFESIPSLGIDRFCVNRISIHDCDLMNPHNYEVEEFGTCGSASWFFRIYQRIKDQDGWTPAVVKKMESEHKQPLKELFRLANEEIQPLFNECENEALSNLNSEPKYWKVSLTNMGFEYGKDNLYTYMISPDGKAAVLVHDADSSTNQNADIYALTGNKLKKYYSNITSFDKVMELIEHTKQMHASQDTAPVEPAYMIDHIYKSELLKFGFDKLHNAESNLYFDKECNVALEVMNFANMIDSGDELIGTMYMWIVNTIQPDKNSIDLIPFADGINTMTKLREQYELAINSEIMKSKLMSVAKNNKLDNFKNFLYATQWLDYIVPHKSDLSSEQVYFYKKFDFRNHIVIGLFNNDFATSTTIQVYKIDQPEMFNHDYIGYVKKDMDMFDNQLFFLLKDKTDYNPENNRQQEADTPLTSFVKTLRQLPISPETKKEQKIHFKMWELVTNKWLKDNGWTEQYDEIKKYTYFIKDVYKLDVDEAAFIDDDMYVVMKSDVWKINDKDPEENKIIGQIKHKNNNTDYFAQIFDKIKLEDILDETLEVEDNELPKWDKKRIAEEEDCITIGDLVSKDWRATPSSIYVNSYDDNRIKRDWQLGNNIVIRINKLKLNMLGKAYIVDADIFFGYHGKADICFKLGVLNNKQRNLEEYLKMFSEFDYDRMLQIERAINIYVYAKENGNKYPYFKDMSYDQVKHIMLANGWTRKSSEDGPEYKFFKKINDHEFEFKINTATKLNSLHEKPYGMIKLKIGTDIPDVVFLNNILSNIKHNESASKQQ